ncbi:MAG: hypothetical protein OEW70_08640 [candidate division WOR-3 bacterium]|nr:hypothetical protein [candidate division WOR-3 bacterium]
MAVKRRSIKIPIRVFETADSKEDIEDWLLSQNKKFIRQMRKARKEDLSGQWITLKKLKRELSIKSLIVPRYTKD